MLATRPLPALALFPFLLLAATAAGLVAALAALLLSALRFVTALVLMVLATRLIAARVRAMHARRRQTGQIGTIAFGGLNFQFNNFVPLLIGPGTFRNGQEFL